MKNLKANAISRPLCCKAYWFSFVKLKIFIPLAISVVITLLDSSSNWSRLLSQQNGVADFSKSLNGASIQPC